MVLDIDSITHKVIHTFSVTQKLIVSDFKRVEITAFMTCTLKCRPSYIGKFAKAHLYNIIRKSKEVMR